jgi:hypothetical protein
MALCRLFGVVRRRRPVKKTEWRDEQVRLKAKWAMPKWLWSRAATHKSPVFQQECARIDTHLTQRRECVSQKRVSMVRHEQGQVSHSGPATPHASSLAAAAAAALCVTLVSFIPQKFIQLCVAAIGQARFLPVVDEWDSIGVW